MPKSLKLQQPANGPAPYFLFAGASAAYVSVFWHWPVATSIVSGIFVILTITCNRKGRRHLNTVAASRADEGLCTFVRALPIRDRDTLVVRATSEEIQAYLRHGHRGFPLRPTDRLVEDLKIDPEDLEDMVVTIAERAGRTLEGYEANPHHASLKTAGDLIALLSAQPKA